MNIVTTEATTFDLFIITIIIFIDSNLISLVFLSRVYVGADLLALVNL